MKKDSTFKKLLLRNKIINVLYTDLKPHINMNITSVTN